MSKNNYRIAVVGAGSLLGKETGDEIAESPLATATTLLLDNELESGTLEAVGDEASFIQTLEPAAFENVDVAIFADAAMLREHGRTARQMGVAVVDATGTLDFAPNAPVRSPLIAEGAPLDLETTVVRVAHPVASALSLVLMQAGKAGALRSAFATVLQPASENGRAGVDELQQQAVSLLSFQPVPKDEFDAQVAFNLLPTLGENAKLPLAAVQVRILRDFATLTGGKTSPPVLQMLQAPVFHGFAVSMFLDFEEPVTADALNAALRSEHLDLVGEEGDPPSNLSSAGQGQILLRVEPASKEAGTRFSLWLTMDNLKLTARTAVACALELTRMRPLGSVQ
ncbi:MAG: Asd/ArgC dimerization domain-containing protein [Janthinobacterium lividum]